jgi:hypothetical protein
VVVVVVVVKGAIGTAIAQPSIAFLGDQQDRIRKKSCKDVTMLQKP